MTEGLLTRRRFAVLGLGALVGCGGPRRSGVVGMSAPGAEAVDGAGSLKAHAAARGIVYGCAVDVEALQNDAGYARLIREQAGMLVAENAMKWAALRPGVEEYRFDHADALVGFAETNGMKVRGHCLCWHKGLPGWFAGEATVENARGLLVEHIERVAGRYAGRMHSWDVVNEAVEVRDGRADGLRDSAWLRLVGEDYVEVAFRAARRADPQALLTYNDYGMEGEDGDSLRKRVAVLQLLRRLKQRGVPVDAVGLQAHLTVGDRFGPGMMAFLAAVRELGLQVFVTELDVDDKRLGVDVAERDDAVGRVYGEFVGLVLHEPALNVVMTWGIIDTRTWLKRADGAGERCLPFDEKGLPMPAFFALRKSFDGRRV